MNVFLFDLDGTLVTTGGAGLKALDRAFDDLYGLKFVVPQINPSGKTDPSIFREIAKRFLDRDVNRDELARISETYLAHLEQTIEAAPEAVRTFPGVESVLKILQGRNDSLFGLGTGNLEEGARLKLGPTGLNSYFAWGAFGSDAEDRAELLRIGRRRAEDRAGEAIPDENVWIIGDTELDVQAAHRAGFRAIAVATGSRTMAELHAAGPDHLIKDMTGAPPLLDKLLANAGNSK